nr:arsenite methyltransferase [Propionibacterium sp.]
MSQPTDDTIRTAVRETYHVIAVGESSGCCGPSNASCCSPSVPAQVDSLHLGYAAHDLVSLPEGADLGLGCGNPGAIAALQPGETVLDLGCGAGVDAFLAARAVGPQGRVIGVDTTPAMIGRARANADSGGYTNVDFRLGEIENLPVADSTVDVIISNCVINLSPDKAAVFRDAFRVLRPGGRLAISDIVASTDIPEDLRRDLSLHSACLGGASPISELETLMARAGFENIRITPKQESKAFIDQWAPGHEITDYVVSATIQAVKPSAGSSCC